MKFNENSLVYMQQQQHHFFVVAAYIEFYDCPTACFIKPNQELSLELHFAESFIYMQIF